MLWYEYDYISTYIVNKCLKTNYNLKFAFGNIFIKHLNCEKNINGVLGQLFNYLRMLWFFENFWNLSKQLNLHFKWMLQFLKNQ